jgi:serine/threonine protein kinase/Tol biopolymer transport system component
MEGAVLHYRLERRLGSGGMGEVWLAHDDRLDRPVALKFLSGDAAVRPDARERLLREARAASRLSHPNIMTMFAVETAGERDFLVMEFLDGRDLRDLAEKNPPGAGPMLGHLADAAEGLAAAHAQGVVHRDVKPDNVMLARDGRVKVMDFGLSMYADATRLTAEGAAVGTFAYMSPEQVRGRDLDARTDVFSFGVMAYELLSGRRPFRSDPSNPAVAIHSLLHDEPPPLAVPGSGLPASLEALLAAALEKDRDRRTTTMTDLARGFRAIRAELEGRAPPVPAVAPASPSAPTRIDAAAASLASAAAPPTPARRRIPGPLAVGSTVLLLALLAAGGFTFVGGLRDAPEEPRPGSSNPPSPAPAALPASPAPAPSPPAVQPARIVEVPGSPSSPTLSPDGQQVAFVMRDEAGVAQIWIKAIAEGDPLQVTRETKDCGGPCWSPRGDLVAYHRKEQVFGPGDAMVMCSLWVFAPPTGAPRRIAAEGSNPSFSPDGERIVSEHLGTLHTCAADGSGRAPLPGMPAAGMPFAALGPRWSPVDARIAYFLPEFGPSGDFWVAPLDGTGPKRLTFDVEPGSGCAWSHDGKRVVFSSSRGGGTTLWSVDASGGTPEPVTTGSGWDTAPEISLDGKRLLYVNSRPTYSLRILDPGAAAARTVIESSTPAGAPCWSPDGARIAYFGGEGPGVHILSVGADGRGRVAVTRGPGEQHVFPQWSADGDWIWFYRRNGQDGTWARVPAAGGAPETVREGWQVFSHVYAEVDPEAKRVAYMRVKSFRELPTSVIEDLETGATTPLPLPLLGCRWSRDGKRVAGRRLDGVAVVVDVEGGRVVDLGRAEHVAWAPGEDRLVLLREEEDGRHLFEGLAADGTGRTPLLRVDALHPLFRQFSVSASGAIAWTDFREGRRELWLVERK